MRIGFGAALAFLVAMPAGAQDLGDLPNRREALRLIFPGNAAVESVVIPHPSLNEAELQLLATAIDQGLMPQMMYYGALAFAPDRGLADPNTTVAVGNFHDEASAGAAATARCEAERGGAGAACEVVLTVRPSDWAEGAALQLSSGAADALRTEFRRLERPRVFAISASTGLFGFGPNLETALAACGAADCQAVVADD